MILGAVEAGTEDAETLDKALDQECGETLQEKAAREAREQQDSDEFSRLTMAEIMRAIKKKVQMDDATRRRATRAAKREKLQNPVQGKARADNAHNEIVLAISLGPIIRLFAEKNIPYSVKIAGNLLILRVKKEG